VITQDQEQKQDIGHVGSGNMNIDDLVSNEINKPSFDVPSDLTCHMRDDQTFYRKMFYPTMVKCQECYNKGEANKAYDFILPMIDSGLKHYQKKYDLPYAEQDLLTIDERKELARKIYEQEIEAFKEGEY